MQEGIKKLQWFEYLKVVFLKILNPLLCWVFANQVTYKWAIASYSHTMQVKKLYSYIVYSYCSIATYCFFISPIFFVNLMIQITKITTQINVIRTTERMATIMMRPPPVLSLLSLTLPVEECKHEIANS